MNILIVAKNSEFGGLVGHTRNLALGLTQLGHKVIIAICKGEGTDRMLGDFRVEHFDWGSKNPLQLIKNYFNLRKVIRSNKIDIIHANNRIPAIYSALYCFFHLKLKYIWANHLVPLNGSLRSRILTRYGYMAVAEGSEGARMLNTTLKIPNHKIRTINLGIDLTKFKRTTLDSQIKLRQELGITPDIKVVLLYGRLCANKGHEFLLDSIARIPNRNFKLVFPGEDQEYRRVIDNKANELGLSNNLIFPGFVSGIDYLSISDLMVLPSMHEGFPQACVEAFAMGVPVIRSKSGGYEDTADMCFGVEYGDVDSFAKLLRDYFENSSIYEERAVYAQTQVSRLSIERMAEAYLKLYEEALRS